MCVRNIRCEILVWDLFIWHDKTFFGVTMRQTWCINVKTLQKQFLWVSTTTTIVHFTHFCTEHSYSIPLQFLLILLNNNRTHPVFAWSYICISWCESWLSSGYFRRFTHVTWFWSNILFRLRNRCIVIKTTTKHLSVNC
jgi:hypothetical protein